MGNYHWRFDYKKSQDLELEPIAKSIVKKPLQKGAKMGVALTLRGKVPPTQIQRSFAKMTVEKKSG
jgi:hypothetical protein